ncbi:hypothetical protein [Streptomyces parvus]|uniref:Secreted protein n=1 Tax=Streptomyces parvus TaxID=66428 RepID=A0A7K3RXT6_9ACTN|nr:hypothetical protein [Streptomyces parvus]NEC20051.1 hypothetical protein [Streptomyces parvus]
MKSATFQKVSATTVAVVALVLGPVAAGSAYAGEPGWQTPVPVVGPVVPDLPQEPGWQKVPREPGWQ